MAKAKHFYETVMEQKVLMDLGVHVAFEGGVCKKAFVMLEIY
jgi:hypothetical protein